MAQRHVFAFALISVTFCIFVTGALATQSKGEDDDAEKVYDLGPGVTPPRIIKQVAPRRTTNRGVRVVGSVTVALVVSSKGIPKDVRIVKGLDKDVDQSTLDAVEQWRFDPAQKDGKPVAVRVSVEVAFHDM